MKQITVTSQSMTIEDTETGERTEITKLCDFEHEWSRYEGTHVTMRPATNDLIGAIREAELLRDAIAPHAQVVVEQIIITDRRWA